MYLSITIYLEAVGSRHVVSVRNPRLDGHLQTLSRFRAGQLRQARNGSTGVPENLNLSKLRSIARQPRTEGWFYEILLSFVLFNYNPLILAL